MVEGGGPLCKRPAFTTADGRYLVVAVSESVRLYGVASGSLAAVLKGHSAEVTAAVLNSRNDAQVGFTKQRQCSSAGNAQRGNVGPTLDPLFHLERVYTLHHWN